MGVHELRGRAVIKIHPTDLLRRARHETGQEARAERRANLRPFARAVRAEMVAARKLARAQAAAQKAAARRSRAQRGAPKAS